MGMYTELIFGARLMPDTPDDVIDTLKYMWGLTDEKPINYPWAEGSRMNYLTDCTSYYFGVSEPVKLMSFDEILGTWVLSSRSNIKNYNHEIETFLEWIKPYIWKGTGSRDMYAIVTYEEDEEPTIYYLYEKCCDEDLADWVENIANQEKNIS